MCSLIVFAFHRNVSVNRTVHWFQFDWKATRFAYVFMCFDQRFYLWPRSVIADSMIINSQCRTEAVLQASRVGLFGLLRWHGRRGSKGITNTHRDAQFLTGYFVFLSVVCVVRTVIASTPWNRFHFRFHIVCSCKENALWPT